jgi:hypothetical protein
VSRFSEYTKLKHEMEICGLKVPVYVTEFGNFIAAFSEDNCAEAKDFATLKKLTEQAIQSQKKNISVPCVILDRDCLRKAEVYGIHAGNGDFLVKLGRGPQRLSKLSSFYEASEAQIEEYNSLAREVSALQKRLFDMRNSFSEVKGSDMAQRVLKQIAGNGSEVRS